MVAFTVRLEDQHSEKLDRIASKLDRSRAYLAAKAIEEFIARETWQMDEIEAGLAEAKTGDFATPEAVKQVIGKYTGR